MKPLLSESQKQHLSKAVADAEKMTSGEIVPAVVRQSDSYVASRWRFAAFFSLSAGLIADLLCPGYEVFWYFGAQAAALPLGLWLGSRPFVIRLITARSVMHFETREKALELFSRKRLGATQDRTGILILVSLLERRVEILADHGIDQKIPPGTWDEMVSNLILHIRQDALVPGLTAAIAECGRLLQSHFPIQAGDRNELCDKVVIEE
jgi:putative membrane protein